MHLTEQQLQKLRELGEEHKLRFMILHGSYATHKERSGSDIDIAIVGLSPLGAVENTALYRGLSDVLGDSGDRELDLKSLYHADPLFRYQVTRDGVLLYGDPREYAQYRMYAFRDYIDSADLRRLESHITRLKQERLAQAIVD